MAATPATCVYCKRNIPHERHVTQLEYLRIFGDMDAYSSAILVNPRADGVVTCAAKEGVRS